MHNKAGLNGLRTNNHFYMQHQIVPCVVSLHSLNGHEEDIKFVEVEGAKFVADEKDPAKPKLDDKGEKIPFVEKKPGESDKVDESKLGELTIEELAKLSPAAAKLLEEKTAREAADKKREADEAAKAEEDAKKKGEWQKLAEERGVTIETLKKELGTKEEILGKYVGSTKQILAEVMKTIPKENVGLIPESFSPREKLEYITQNAKLLGATIVGSGKGGKVDKNDADPNATDEEKLATEIEELRKKPNKTQTELNVMFEKAQQLKKLQTAKKNKA